MKTIIKLLVVIPISFFFACLLSLVTPIPIFITLPLMYWLVSSAYNERNLTEKKQANELKEKQLFEIEKKEN